MNKKVALKRRGAVAFTKQIREAGGTYSTDEVSQLLCITKNEVDEQTGSELLGVQLQDRMAYPCWQFDGNKIVEHFSEVMVLLNTTPVTVVQFFLTTDENINKSPIDALHDGNENELGTVKLLAQQFEQQVAR